MNLEVDRGVHHQLEGRPVSSSARAPRQARRESVSAASARGGFIVLLQGRDQQDPLFLQVKEATASVLEDHLPKSRYPQPGERVVQGQRMMQAASDISLGWTKGAEANRYLYWGRLRDMKGSAVVEAMTPDSLTFYARICGKTLARAHARTGDRSRSPQTSAQKTASSSQSPTSPSATQTRTTRTTRSSARRYGPASWKRSRAGPAGRSRGGGNAVHNCDEGPCLSQRRRVHDRPNGNCSSVLRGGSLDGDLFGVWTLDRSAPGWALRSFESRELGSMVSERVHEL